LGTTLLLVPNDEVAVTFTANAWTIGLTAAWAAKLADLLDELATEGTPGAAGARSRLDHALESGVDGLEWYPDEKDALAKAINRWIDRDTYPMVPERVRDLRYILFGEWQDDIKGVYLFELERDGRIIEMHRELDRSPAKGQHLTIAGSTWIVESVAPLVGGEYVATMRARWYPG
jgi:hypothetical protein